MGFERYLSPTGMATETSPGALRPLELRSSKPGRARVTGKRASKERNEPRPDHHDCTIEAYLSLGLHTHHLAVLHDDVVHRLVQHICPPVDGTQSVVKRVTGKSPTQEKQGPVPLHPPPTSTGVQSRLPWAGRVQETQ